jgi:pyruvate/2-oxoglutarate dehydrogenase complex dihydrolipoamide dehydrogenase (E3) component
MQIQVHLFEASNRVLGNDLPEAGAAVTAALRAVGVELHLSASIDKVERRGHNVIVTANGTETVADEVLVAAGRRANTDELNLAGVGVNTDKAGQIVVDRFLRTSNTRIFAAGDVCAKQQFTHTADAHARIVVQNALFLPTASTRKLVIPHCTYTHPEVASVGESRQTLAANNRDFAVYRVAFDDLDRGKAQGDMEGFVEVLAEPRNGKILGATIVGTDAGEQIAPLCLAMTHGIGLGALAKTVLPYPTRAEYLRRLGDAFNRNKLTARAKRLFATWFRWSLRS